MSYQVFARKYRPQTFKEVIGQDHVTNTLANAIARNRLAHAFLFVGPRGTGKTSTARIFAKSLNCATGPTIEPCGVCDACTEIARGNCLDVLEIDGASNNGVEQVRELRENARFSPARDRFKIYIIDEVHMLTTSAFNALLKTLEEPPAHVKFIFATTEVHKVLPTILSRCQRFDMRRIPTTLIAEHLQHIARNESIELAPTAAATIARAADGGLRDAESMLDQLAAFCGAHITEDDVTSVFGITPMRQVAILSGAILGRDIPAALDLLKNYDQSGKDLSRLLDDLIQHLRALLVTKVNPDSAREDVDPEMRALLDQQAVDIDAARIMELIEQFATTEGRMRWAPNKRLHFEVAIVRASQFLGQTTLDEVLAAAAQGGVLARDPVARKPTASDRETTSKKSVPPRTTVAPVAPTPPVSTSLPRKPAPSRSAPTSPVVNAPLVNALPEDSAAKQHAKAEAPSQTAAPGDAPAVWKKLCALIESQRPLFVQWLRAGTALSIDDRSIRVGFATADKAARESLLRPNAQKILRQALEEVTGKPMDVVLDLSAELASVTREDPLEKAVQSFDNDPLITDAVQRFQARRLDI